MSLGDMEESLSLSNLCQGKLEVPPANSYKA